MDYKIVITSDAKKYLDKNLQYLIFEKALDSLKYFAESFPLCNNPRLKTLSYRRINF